MKIFRMSKKAKIFIIKHKDVKPRPLEDKILDELNEKVGYRTIYEFLKSEEFAHLSHSLAQFAQPKPEPKKKLRPPTQKQRNGFQFSIHHVNELLKKNPNHYHAGYLNAQINGGEYKGKMFKGRLKSDFEKLLVFLRDTDEK